MIITDEFLNNDKLSEYMEDTKKDCNSSYLLRDFSEIITGFKMNICVDIGSNVGIFSMMASSFFKNVYGFEPSYLPECISKNLLITHSISNVRIFNLAVTDNTGDILLLKSVSHPDGKRLSKDNTLVINPSNIKEKNLTEPCMTISLKDVFTIIDSDFIDYLKIDAEGSEYSILMNQDLSNIGILVGEIHSIPNYNFEELKSNFFDYLTNFFTVFAIEHNFIALNSKFCTEENLKNFNNLVIPNKQK